MVRVTVLASGSRGNCTLVSSSRTCLLVDAGLSCRETLKRLRQAGEDPGTITAILISHEHNDHIDGLKVLARKLRVPVYITQPTHHIWYRAVRKEARQLEQSPVDLARKEFFEAGRTFQIGDIAVTPFTIPHDAADPVGFAFSVEGVKVGLVTDLGYMPASVRQQLRGCDILMIESNHDIEMLRGGPYPWVVKQRVMSRVGHLSNDCLAEFFTNDYDGAAAFVILAHLSEHNNHPELARTAAERALALRCGTLFSSRVKLASQDQPLAPVVL
ncbi:MAG: MBL fold metallo-hydrolase [Acidobacteriales bacterium]|nr:MBL fold metallo-hydrolase [Terriglobales bacterium]